MVETRLTQAVKILFLFWLIIAALYYAQDFLIPIAFAAILSMLLLPVAHYFERKGWSKGISALTALLLFILGAGAIISLLSWQVSGLAEDVGQMQQRIQGQIDKLQQYLSSNLNISAEQQKEMLEKQQQSGSGNMPAMAAAFLSGVMGFLVDLLLTLVYMFLFLYFRTHLKKFIIKLVPDDNRQKAVKILHESSKVGQQYLTGLAMMIVMLWVLYGIGFSIVGVKNALFFAVLCGLLEIVPFIGNLLGNALAVLMVITQGGDSGMIIGVLITYGLVQFVQSYLLEPLVVGAEVNLNPLFTILVLVLGELLWGIAGMVLAIPLLGIVKVVFDHIPALQPYGFLIGEEKKKKKSGLSEKISGLFKKK